MTPADQFVRIIETLMWHDLKLVGFKKKGGTFVRETRESYEIVNLQRSQSSTATSVTVTVNLGVYVRAVDAFIGRPPRPVTSVWETHWQQRLSHLLGENDKWWTVSDETTASEVGTAIAGALAKAGIPAIESMSTEACIRAALSKGLHPGRLSLPLCEYLGLSREDRNRRA